MIGIDTKLLVRYFVQDDADFPDYLIGRRNAAAGCEHTVTFDKDLMGHPAFIVL